MRAQTAYDLPSILATGLPPVVFDLALAALGPVGPLERQQFQTPGGSGVPLLRPALRPSAPTVHRVRGVSAVMLSGTTPAPRAQSRSRVTVSPAVAPSHLGACSTSGTSAKSSQCDSL